MAMGMVGHIFGGDTAAALNPAREVSCKSKSLFFDLLRANNYNGLPIREVASLNKGWILSYFSLFTDWGSPCVVSLHNEWEGNKQQIIKTETSFEKNNNKTCLVLARAKKSLLG